MYIYIIDKGGEGYSQVYTCPICVFCLINYNCIVILQSVTVFVCHDKGNVFYSFFVQ